MLCAVDGQAARQIERLFHAQECMIWELIDVPASTKNGDLPIHRADGKLVTFARPAVPSAAEELSLLGLSTMASTDAAPAGGGPTLAIIVYAATFALTLLFTAGLPS
jgi:hypothetical protein